MAVTPEKRMVVITKESMFYVPEDNKKTTPMQPTRQVSKINRSLDDTDAGLCYLKKPGILDAEYCKLALYLVAAFFLFFALFGLLWLDPQKVPLLGDKQVPMVAAGVGASLGYITAHILWMRSL